MPKFSVPEFPLPPRDTRNHDDAAFIDSAIYNLSRISQVVQFSPAMHIVDIGCASGRLSLPLLTYLNEAEGGSYMGLDVDPRGPEWATANITPRYPHFEYRSIDVHNDYMNAQGRIQPQDFKFPIQNDWADLVILHSVFTHMRDAGIRGYVKEISRMLRPGGYLYFTLFLFDSDAKKQCDNGTASWVFPHEEQGVLLHRLDRPEWAVAISEGLFTSLATEYALTLHTLIRGPWRDGVQGGQDVAYFTK
jgi:SAM-dependent methyltransferase